MVPFKYVQVFLDEILVSCELKGRNFIPLSYKDPWCLSDVMIPSIHEKMYFHFETTKPYIRALNLGDVNVTLVTCISYNFLHNEINK